MRYPGAKWNPSPDNCFTKKFTKKIAVCNHRTVGWIGYLRNFDHLKEGRTISAHFTVALDGSVEQHVDTDYVAWTQGVSTAQYAYAASNWSLFKNRNPNIDCIGIEHEDGAKPFNDARPMPEAQLEATIALHKWLFENVIEADCVRGETLISHDMLTTNRSGDPGEWLMGRIAAALQKTRDVGAASLRRDDYEARLEALEEWQTECQRAADKTVERVADLENWRKS